MDSSEFDDIIKNKLDKPVKLDDHRAWDLFMLNAIEKGEEDLFEDKSADDLVKKAFKDFKVEYNPETWDALEQKISQNTPEPILTSRFDKEVSNSLKSVKRKYDAASWPRLAARIEAEEVYLKHYYRAKVVEALLFLFLVVTIFQITKSEWFNKDLNSENFSAVTGINATFNDEFSAQNLNSGSMSTGDIRSGIHSSGLNGINLKNSASQQMEKLFNSITHFTGSSLNNINLQGKIQGRTPIEVSLLQNPNDFKALLFTNERTIEDEISSLSLASLSTAKQMPAALLEKNNPILINDWAILSVPDLSKKPIEKGQWRVGMYARADYNEIKLPAQTIYIGNPNPFSAKTVKSKGYAAGFKATYIHEHLGFETGLGYANRSYAPNRRYFGEKYYNYNFANIEYNIIELPVFLRYGTNSINRLNSYVQVGFNANIIAQAIYDVKAEYRSVGARGSGNVQDDQYQLSRFKEAFSKFDKRRALMYAQGAAGLDWKANQNVNIYTQLTFGQQLFSKQIGPNFDQAKSLSLELGLRTKI
ncbi:MAG: outer membrane beta-barrel protein [Saprospiraceae bacterium]